MIYPVDRLIDGQELITARENESVRDALTKMVRGDFSQLPIVDSQGRLSGIISDTSISRSIYHAGSKVSVLELKVTDCSEKPITLPSASDVLDALALLRTTSAIVVVNDNKPVGILTNADAITFFRELSEGLVLIEDMEMTLRQYIDEAFTTTAERTTALENAFKHRMKGDTEEDISWDRLTLGDYINLVTNNKNWGRLETAFVFKDLFRAHMEQVREIRNQIVHFRGRPDAVQYDALKRAHHWLEGCYRRKTPLSLTIVLDPLQLSATGTSSTVVSHDDRLPGKYGPLRQELERRADKAPPNDILTVPLAWVEEIIGEVLPPSARQHRAWWANDSTSSRQSEAWMSAGWAVDDIDFRAEVVSFKRTDIVLYQIFWSELVERLKAERPGFSRNSKSFAQYYCSFSAGKSGFSYMWAFSSNRDELWTELVIDTRSTSSKAAKHYFNQLKNQQEEIEREFGGRLKWDPRPDRVATRIYAAYPFRITDTPENREEAKAWAIEAIQRLADAMQHRITELTPEPQFSSEALEG